MSWEQLLADWKPLFETLHKEHGLTHFYFSDAKRVCLLRLHKPEKHGDRFDRFTILEAERTGMTASGIELGPLGTFALRVVRPVFDGGTLVGYLELGKEIEDALSGMRGKSEERIGFMLRNVSLAAIASIDVFLLLSMCPTHMKLRWLCVVLAPLFHILMCVAGWGVAAQIRPWVPTAVFISISICFIIGGVMLTVMYEPGGVKRMVNSSIIGMAVMIFFSSLDALAIGYAYNMVNTPFPTALFCMGVISTGAALAGYYFSSIIKITGDHK